MTREEFIEKLSNTLNTYKGATDGKSLRMENIAVKALVSQFGINESYEAVNDSEELAEYLSKFVTSSAFADGDDKKEEETKAEEAVKAVPKADIADVKAEADEEAETPTEVLLKSFKKKHKEAQLKRGKICFSGYRFYYGEDGKFVMEDVTSGSKVPFKETPTDTDILEFFAPKEVKREPVAERTEGESPVEKTRKHVLELVEAGESGNLVLIDSMVKKDKRKAKEFLKKMQDGDISQDEFLDEVRNICEGRYDAEKSEKKAKKEEAEELVPPYEFPKFKTVGQLVGDKIEVDGEQTDAVPFLAQWILAFEPRMAQDLFKMSQGEIDVTEMYQPYKEGEFPTEKSLDLELLPNNAKLAQEISKVCRYLIGFAPQDVVYIADTDLVEGDTIHVLGVEEDKKKSKPTAVVVDPTDTGILHTEKYRFIYKTDVWYKCVMPTRSKE